MRQALTIMMVGLWVALAAPARGDGPPPASEPPIIARARRLIQAGDREAAVGLLEDALIDGPAGEKPAVVELLRRAYETMAREAEAAGRTEAAAHYRDNLAILPQAHEAPRPAPAPGSRLEPARPRVEPARPRIEPAPALVRPTDPKKAGPSGRPEPEASVAPSAGAEPPAESIPPELRAPMPAPDLSEPAPLPEPAKLPMPGPERQAPPAADAGAMTRVPRSDATIVPAADGTRAIPMTRPTAPEPDAVNGREALVNPGEVVGPAGPSGTDAGPAPGRSRNPKTGAGAAEAPAAGPPAGSADLATADQLFRAQNFDESGRVYAALAARNLLPADRRPHWAYCRFKAVVRRINAGPRSSREWDAIEAEIRSIQRLTPGIWYGEYLLNMVAEARRSQRRRGGTSDKMIVRGSSPDDPAPPLPPQGRAPERRRLGRSRGTSAAGAPAPPAASPTPSSPPAGEQQPLNLPGNLSLPEAPSSDASPRTGEAAGAPRTSGSNEAGAVSWQVHESPNFRIYHCDPGLAERAAAVAESVRTAQSRRWGSTATRAPWSPRCDLYLYPTAQSYAEATGQPVSSPGLSTMSTNGVRVLARRMSLRADNPLMLTATLPHEVTHVVLADMFVAQIIPRWADEGLAVLAEPETELRHREADLKDPLGAGRVFEAGQLMAMDYPDPKDWRLFYAQSVSLTRFLVEQGPPERFIQFVRDTQRMGTEAALRDVYHIDGLAALQERWLEYARKQVAADVASSRDAAATPTDIRRD